MKMQRDKFSCGTFAVLNALAAVGKRATEKRVRVDAGTTRAHGTTDHGIRQALDRQGFTGSNLPTSADAFWSELTVAMTAGDPCILLVDDAEHWVAVIGKIGQRVLVFDSDGDRQEHGIHVFTQRGLMRRVGARRFGIRMRPDTSR